MRRTTIVMISGASAFALLVLAVATTLLFYYRPTIQYAYTRTSALLLLANALGLAVVIGMVIRARLRKWGQP